MPDYVNEFNAPSYIEETILNKETGKTVGTIRVKPSSVLWKPSGNHKFYSVPLDTFTKWITDAGTGADKVKS